MHTSTNPKLTLKLNQTLSDPKENETSDHWVTLPNVFTSMAFVFWLFTES